MSDGHPFASQHTTSFSQLLRELGASLAVSTYQAGRLILLRARESGLNTHFLALERPMGLATDTGRLAVGTAARIMTFRNLPAVARRLDPPDRHDACYLLRTTHVTGDIDVHEMAYDGEGDLWLVNTRMSCLCTLDCAWSVVPRWRPPFVTALDLNDRCHLNGLGMQDGRPAWATALGETDSPAGWRADRVRGGVLLDVRSGSTVAGGLCMPHSPRWHAGRLWLLESGAGTLVTVDRDTGARTVVAELPGFTRGLAFAGRYAFVGLSQVRDTAVFAGLPLTSRQSARHCGVWAVDIQTGRIIGYVTFTGSVSEVFALSLLGWRDPEVLAPDSPLLQNSYALPDAALRDLAAPDPTRETLERALDAGRAGDHDTAIALCRELLAGRPEHTEVRMALARTLGECDRHAEVISVLEPVVERDAMHAEAQNRLGVAHASLGQHDLALGCYDRAIAADAMYAQAHFNRALVHLRRGDFQRGWADYEWRWQLSQFHPLQCPQPRWRGEDIGDRTLLVHTEQGAGDALMFARFLPLAAGRCRRLLLVCTAALKPVLETVPGVARVYLPGRIEANVFDVYCPLLSLPGVLGISARDLPGPMPWLVPRAEAGPRLPAGAAGVLRVGLVWAGSPGQRDDRHRSCPMALLEPLPAMEGCEWYSLQTPVDAAGAEWLRRHRVANLAPDLTDYGRTAACIRQLDLVISVCTSVAHLAGSMGAPVWVLLSHNPDWRWGDAGSTSAWYPTARLFRQPAPGDWASVIHDLRQALESRAAGSGDT